jgi:hypothetical protein
MNVETGTEAAQFPEKEYINGIFVAGGEWWPYLLVLAKRMTFAAEPMPSISTSSWLRVWSASPPSMEPPAPMLRCRPIASISSM